MGLVKMSDENEIVSIEIMPAKRMELDRQISEAMNAKGFADGAYRHLGLGFTLPLDWPDGKDVEITMAQLVVLAKKLDLKIVISDLCMVPRKKDGSNS